MGIRSGEKLLRVFIALSFLSLFADIVYEGARSIGGAYLNLLAAPAIVAGVLGFGEFLSNVMRLVGGIAAHRASSGRAYWALILVGYGMNVFIPILALAGSWEIALLLFFLERLGKGIRAPPRDVILAEITEGMGRGKGFGIHELLDQIGAVTGPLLVSLIIFLRGYPEGYRAAFWIMWIPAILAIGMLILAMKLYPKPKVVTEMRKKKEKIKLDRRFWIFTAGSMITMLGFLYWGIIAYYAEDSVKIGLISAGEIPAFYLIAMAVDAVIAVPIGATYDKVGAKSVIAAPLAALFISPTLFAFAGRIGFYLAAVFWGLAMGVIETTMRAAVADMTTIESRSLAYGVYSFGIGSSWMIGGVILGFLYQIGLTNLIIAMCTAAEIVAIVIFASLLK